MESIVVGVNGTAESLGALRWAQELAGLIGARVEAVSAWALPPAAGSDAGAAADMTFLYEELGNIARENLAETLADVPSEGINRSSHTEFGASISGGLIHAAAESDLLVLGARRHGGFERFLGTTALQCVQYATCPVIVVPDTAQPLTDTIAVAFDGSESSHHALRWAADVASNRDLVLRVISVWEGSDFPGGPLFADETVDTGDRAIEGLRAAVAAVVPDLQANVEYVAVEAKNKVVAHLLESAEGASLLVLGTRGRGGFRGLLLGSVSQRCLESATIPVAVIRGA
jgi:nucleotide-binding universal stress UspA family protein